MCNTLQWNEISLSSEDEWWFIFYFLSNACFTPEVRVCHSLLSCTATVQNDIILEDSLLPVFDADFISHSFLVGLNNAGDTHLFIFARDCHVLLWFLYVCFHRIIPSNTAQGSYMSPSSLESLGCHLILFSYLLSSHFSAEYSCSFLHSEHCFPSPSSKRC